MKNKSWLFRVGIVVMAAVLVEIISIIQYERVQKIMRQEMNDRSQIILTALADDIVHNLEITETTMNENVLELRRSLAHPDSVYSAIKHVIDDNPHVIGGCMAFVPGYYPSKGRLYEPYVSKENGGFVMRQLAENGHDYTQNEAFRRAATVKAPVWSDPYAFGPDSLKFATYSYPLMDRKGRLAAVCGLDLDLSWLGDTLNARHHYPSSFRLLLTQSGKLVAGPSSKRISPEVVHTVMEILSGKVPASAHPEYALMKGAMDRAPYWQVVQVHRTDEVFERMHRMRRQQMLFILLALAILAFMINRYAHNDKKLRKASQEQARLGGELAVASRIQHEMLPKTFPPFVYGSLEPAREVGGDIFDFFNRDGKLFFCIGDVSGKGVPSAILMSVVHSIFRMTAGNENSPSRILHVMNQELCRSNDSNMFITFFVGCLDLYSGELIFSNAGHDKPFVMCGTVTQLDTKANLPLGVFPDTNFIEQNCTLAPGTTLVLYTDGLTEAKNVERRQFGLAGVQQLLEENMASGVVTPVDLVSSMSEAAHSFAGSAPQSDDLTMLVIRYAPENLVRESITLENDIADISKLSAFVKGFCGSIPIERSAAANIRLALEEAVVNVMKYAFPDGDKGTVTVLADSNRQELRFTVIDCGIPFNPTSVMEVDTTLDVESRPIGGLGIHLVRRLTDSLHYQRKAGRNILTMTKKI